MTMLHEVTANQAPLIYAPPSWVDTGRRDLELCFVSAALCEALKEVLEYFVETPFDFCDVYALSDYIFDASFARMHLTGQ